MSLLIDPSSAKQDPKYLKLSATSSSLPESVNVGQVMGRQTTIISVFAASMKSPYIEETASTMPKSTT
eukprot:362971-Chlamydomonas_euryale.AAC.4